MKPSKVPAPALGSTAPIDVREAALSRLEGDRAAFGETNESLWIDAVQDRCLQQKAPPFSGRADVVIVGAGLTGLWTAYYLKKADPNLSVVILEANSVAFGASGRAGGWLIGSLDNQSTYFKDQSEDQARNAVAQIRGTVDEVARVITEEGIQCGFHKGGMIRIGARNEEQLKGLLKYRNFIEAENNGERIGRALSAEETRRLTKVESALGGAFYPECAVANPAQLCFGLARALIRLGVTIVENCRATDWSDNHVSTERGTIDADWIVPACEGYSDRFAPTADRMLPVYSHIIATEPLSDRLRNSIGMENREAFSDCSAISTYGQITEDGRLVFGALGTYPFASNLARLSDRKVKTQYRTVYSSLIALWPQLREAKFTHAWSGALGVPRSLRAAIVEVRDKRLIWGGGYVGRGLAAANLFGRTMADLVCGHDNDRTRCPWVYRDAGIGDAFKRWEPEPLKWLGISLVTAPGEIRERALQSSYPAPIKATMVGLTKLIPELR